MQGLPNTGMYVQHKSSDLLKPYLGASRIKVIKKDGAATSIKNFKRLCGEDEPENNFPNVWSLDLEL